MAALTGGKASRVKGQGITVGELGVLPLVINRKSADELVIVQRTRQVGLMTGGTEFRRLIERLHDGLRVTLRMLQDIAEWNFAGNAVAFLVYHDCGHTHHIATIPGGRLQSLDRMAGGAG